MLSNLEYYKVFYYVVTCGSVTKAAESLSLSQPAVSQSIKQLEGLLGVTLLKRTARGIEPTAEGKELFFYVSRGYEQFETGEKRLLQMKNLERGEITIGASDMTLKFFLLPALERFHEKYPGIRVSVTNGPTPATMRLLQEGRIDFGVVSGPLVAPKDVEMYPVRTIEDIFVAGKNFFEYREKILPLKKLEELPLIMLDTSTSTRAYVQQFLTENEVFVKPEFELATSDMIVQFARRNLGVGCVMADFACEELKNGTLIKLLLEKRIPPRKLLIVTDKKSKMNLAAARLLEDIHDQNDPI